MALPRFFSAHVVLSERLYVFGGRDSRNRNTNSVEYYDPLAGTWMTVAPMRHNRIGAAAHVLNDLIYVLGGWNVERRFNTERYDPQNNTWIEVRLRTPVVFYFGGNKIFHRKQFLFSYISSWNLLFRFQDIGSLLVLRMAIGFILLAVVDSIIHRLKHLRKSTLSPVKWSNWGISACHATIIL